MKITFAIKDGTWSDPSIWNEGTLPSENDEVCCEGKSIIVDQDIKVGLICNENLNHDTYGGKLLIDNNVKIESSIIAFCNPVIEYSGTGTLSIIGSISGGSCGEFSAILNKNTGTIEVSGNVRGGDGGYAYGINNLNTGTISITGNVSHGIGGYSYGLYNTENGTLIVNNKTTNLSGGYYETGVNI